MIRRDVFRSNYLCIVTLACLAASSLDAADQAVLDNPTVKPVSRPDPKWGKRQSTLNERIQSTPDARILFIGDSITQGWEGAGKDVWQKYYGNRKAVNLGIGGDRTEHVLWRLDHGNADGVSPKLAVVMIGTNNVKANSPEQIAEGIIAVNAKLKEKLPQTKVLILGVFPRSATPNDQPRQATVKINEIVKSRAESEGFRYLDIGKEFLSPDGTLSKEIMPDLLHLSPKGYEIWAKAIEPTIVEIVGPADDSAKK